MKPRQKASQALIDNLPSDPGLKIEASDLSQDRFTADFSRIVIDDDGTFGITDLNCEDAVHIPENGFHVHRAAGADDALYLQSKPFFAVFHTPASLGLYSGALAEITGTAATLSALLPNVQRWLCLFTVDLEGRTFIHACRNFRVSAVPVNAYKTRDD
jgi:hypothetical protein